MRGQRRRHCRHARIDRFSEFRCDEILKGMGIGFHHEGCIIAALELLLVDLRHASGKNLASSWGPFVSSEVERHTHESRGSWFGRNARLALAIRPATSIWTPMTYKFLILGGGLDRKSVGERKRGGE